MPLVDLGNGNQVEGVIPEKLEVRFKANDCFVRLPQNSKLEGKIEFYQNRGHVYIGDETRGRIQIFVKGYDARMIIGSRVTINNLVWANLAESRCSVTIGDDCLIGSARFRPSDSHKIFDLSTGERSNPARPIVVGNRVWLAEDVILLKGSIIGDGSVVGLRTIVTGQHPPQTLIVGTPGRVIREGIRWEE